MLTLMHKTTAQRLAEVRRDIAEANHQLNLLYGEQATCESGDELQRQINATELAISILKNKEEELSHLNQARN